MNPEEDSDSDAGKRSKKKYKSKAEKEKALGRKYEIPILRQSHSTLGSLNMDFVEEPWKDPIRFDYDITMLERDMLALCSGKVSHKYSWHPLVPSSYIRLKCNQAKRPKTAGCPQNVCEVRDELQRTESECILYLAGLGKPRKSGIFVTVPVVTRDASTLVDIKDSSDCTSNKLYCPNTAMMNHSAALDHGTAQTKSIEANEEINYGGISWLKQVVSSIVGSSPTSHHEDQQGSFESAGTTDQVYCVWNKRPGGIEFPMESNAETIPSSQVLTSTHQSRHSTAVVSFSENVNAEGFQRAVELNNPALFPTISEAACMAPAATEVPPHPTAGHEQDFCVSAHNADFTVASNSRRYMLSNVGSPVLQDSPSQTWIASTQFFSQNNETRRISLEKAISRSRRLQSCKILQMGDENPQILQYICGVPTARPRKIDSSLQVRPLDFVDSNIGNAPHRCIESAMKIDFANIV